MRLAIFVQYRSLRIHSHSRGAEFMNDHAAIGDSVGPWRVRACLRGINSARGLNNGAKRLLHILRHLDLVIAPLPMKAQHGDSPLIDGDRIDIAVALRVGNHFTTAFQADIGAVHGAANLLECEAVALKFFTHTVKFAYSWHSAAAIHLDAISPEEIVLTVELPP